MLSMYKAGQGYWTRMMSAIFFGVLVAGGALWLSGQIESIDFKPESWRYTVESDAASLAPNSEVELQRSNVRIGSAFVRSVDGDTVELVNLNMGAGNIANGVQSIVVEGQQPVIVEGLQVVQRFEKTYLQGGVAAATLLLGAIIIFYLCYTNKRTSEFLIATEGEMKKVNWSSRREVFGSTWVVIGISVIIATILFVTDILFQWIAQEINLIQI
jgi:preprotein translocase SecE subunit